jgi:hypothetical protein
MDANHLSTRFMPVSADSPRLVAAAALCVLALMSCLAHADLKGPCVASADDRPRIALISAFSNEATAYIAQMQRDDAANHFQGCVVINGYRFVKGRLRGKKQLQTFFAIAAENQSRVVLALLDALRGGETPR